MFGNENVLEAALTSVGDAVIVTDEKARIAFINPVAATLTGWSAEDAAEQPLAAVFRIVNERTRAPVDDPVAKVLQTGVVQGLANHTILLAKDGREVPIDDSAAPVKLEDGRVIGAVLVFRDITERRRAEVRAGLLAAIVECSDDAIISKSIDGTITSWNPAAERLYGYAASEIIGRSIMTIVPPELVAEERDILARLRAGERIEHFDTVRVAKDGRRIDVSLAISPVRDEDGVVIGASKIARDIGKRKEFEGRLREEQRLKDEFLATLGHELRNPIAPIQTAAELLFRLSLPDPRATAAAGVIHRQTRQLKRLVDDLLDLARVTQGRITLDAASVDLGEVIAEGVEMVGPLIRGKHHQLIEVWNTRPLFVRGDKARLVQCIGNVVGNAAKYTDSGGQIRVSLRSEGAHAVVEIADNGIGIAPELLPRVFDLFVQGSRSLDRTEGGLGIGLSMVKRIVEMHGGEVSVRSEGPRRGSTFELRLPLAQTPGSDRPAPIALEAPRRRVLIVDDNADAADSLGLLLSLRGHETQVVYGAREALAQVEGFRPDTALLDIGLPEMDGYELARHLRAMPGLQGLRLIALTGYGQAADFESTRAAGFDDHLVKPADLPALERALAGMPALTGR
jgi:PAS domain S-box-containing protein